MKNSTGQKMVPIAGTQTNSSHPSLFKHTTTSVKAAFHSIKGRIFDDQGPWLPQHRSQPAATTQNAPNPSTSTQTRHLMSCLQTGKYRSLYQELVQEIQCDKELFAFLQNRLEERKGKVRPILSLQTIRGIVFVKVRIPKACVLDT